MSDSSTYPYPNPNPYVPASLSEIYDLVGSMILSAPTFDKEGAYPEYSVDTEFHALTQGFGLVREKLGEARYAQLIDLAAQAKRLFANDPDDDNGKTDQGRDLLFEIEDLIQATRSHRVAAKMKDEEGEISGD